MSPSSTSDPMESARSWPSRRSTAKAATSRLRPRSILATKSSRGLPAYSKADHAALRVNPFQQLFREHLLAQAAVMRGDYAEAYFVQVAPYHNHLVQNAARLYEGFLVTPAEGQVPFVNVTLEQVIEAYGWAGQHSLAASLWERYCDWWAVDEVIRDAVKVQRETWLGKPAAKATLLPNSKAA